MQFRELGREPLNALRAGDEVQEQNSLLEDSTLLEHLDGHYRRATCLTLAGEASIRHDLNKLTRGEHGIQQQHPSISDVFGYLGVKQLWLARLLVTLDENLADTHGAAALAQPLLHRLARPHDRNTADLALEREAIIMLVRGRDDGVLHRGQVVQTLLH